jgi:hypothetical protein
MIIARNLRFEKDNIILFCFSECIYHVFVIDLSYICYAYIWDIKTSDDAHEHFQSVIRKCKISYLSYWNQIHLVSRNHS